MFPFSLHCKVYVTTIKLCCVPLLWNGKRTAVRSGSCPSPAESTALPSQRPESAGSSPREKPCWWPRANLRRFSQIRFRWCLSSRRRGLKLPKGEEASSTRKPRQHSPLGGCFVGRQLTKPGTELEIEKSSDCQNGTGFFTKGSL